MESAAILFTVLLAFMEIRHAVNNGDVYRQSAGLTEVALQVCVTLAMAIGLERLRLRTGSVVHNASAILLTVFAGLAAVFGLMVLETPILWPIDVGGVVINLLLLGIGILFNSQRARLASAAVIALTILKAFVIDMSTLTGVYRALSFMCLGLVLVAIGWLYQRILFRRQAAASAPPAAPAGA